MIPNNIFYIAKSHADALQDSIGKVIVPAGRSVLSTLVGMSYAGDIPEGAEASVGEYLEAITGDDGDGPSPHTAVIGERIDSLINLVSGHIAFVQNQVRPKVVMLEDKLTSALNEADGINPLSLFNVMQVDAPALNDNDDFMSLVDHFGDRNANIPRMLGTLPAQSPEQLRDFMRVSSNGVNTDLDAWLDQMGDDWLLDIWHHYFASGNTQTTGALTGNAYINFEGIQGLPVFNRIAVSTAVFLLSRGLLDAPLEESMMSLEQWRDSMDAISRYTGGQILNAQYLIKSVKDRQIVILGVFDDGRSVTVYTPAYTAFLEQGGTVEDILGAAISNESSSYDLEALKEGGTRFNDIWKSFQATSRSTLDYRNLISLQSAAKHAFEDILIVEDNDEQIALNAVYGRDYSMEKIGNDYIDSLCLADFRDASCVALNLVARIRYPHTPAFQFLGDMIEASKAGCTSPQEAALIAAQNYVADAIATELALANP